MIELNPHERPSTLHTTSQDGRRSRGPCMKKQDGRKGGGFGLKVLKVTDPLFTQTAAREGLRELARLERGRGRGVSEEPSPMLMMQA
jgi:hypothetical protein